MEVSDAAGMPETGQREHSVDQNTADLTTLANPDSETALGFRAQDRRVMTVLMSVLLLWLAVEWIIAATRSPDPLLLHRGPEFQASFRVDVNHSIWVDWIQLEGIGPALAQRIIADREIHGDFSSIDDVSRVPGIGPATLARIRPWLTINNDPPESASANDDQRLPSGNEAGH